MFKTANFIRVGGFVLYGVLIMVANSCFSGVPLAFEEKANQQAKATALTIRAAG